MSEILSGIAIVLALVAIIAVLSLAHELSVLRTGVQPLPSTDDTSRSVDPREARTLTGGEVTLPPARGAVLLFVMKGCPPCDAVLDTLREASSATRSALYIIARADEAFAHELVRRTALAADRVIVDDGVISEQFSVSAYPMAAATTDRRIQRVSGVGSVADLDRLEELVRGQSTDGHSHNGHAGAQAIERRMEQTAEIIP